MAAGLIVVVPLLLVAVVAVVVLVLLAGGTVGSADLLETTARARRHAVRGSVLAMVAAAVVAAVGPGALANLRTGAPHAAFAAIPALAGLAHLAVLALTERTWPHPSGTVRSARLAPRGVASVTPPGLAHALIATAATLPVTVVVAAVLADPAGRSISVGDRQHGSSAGPFPGLPYGLPALVAVAVLLAASVLVLRLVVARPAVEGADAATDSALRRAGAHRVLRGALAATLLTTGPLLFFAGTAAHRVHDGSVGAAAVVVAAAGALAALAGLLALTLPAPRVPAPQPGAPLAVGRS